MKTWNYVSYDVWGNETDGYEVNQAFRTSQSLELSAAPNDAELIQALKSQLDWTIPDVSKFSADWHEDVVYLEYDGKPEGEFRLAEGGIK